MLLLTLTIAWASWRNDDDEHDHKDKDVQPIADDDGNQTRLHQDGDAKELHAHITGYQVNPGRIVVASTIGVIVVNVKSILW